MSGHAGGEIAGAIGLCVLITSVITMIIWQLGATVRAKALLAQEQKYRQLAERATKAQEDTEQRLADLTGELADLRTRVDAMDRILTEVD